MVSAAFGPTGSWILGAYPLLRVLPLAVSLLQRVTFSKRQKGNPKCFAPAYGPLAGARGTFYGTDPGAAAPVGFAAPTLAVYDCVVRSLRSHTRIDPVTKPAERAKDQKQKPKPDQEPLTLALSQRERELTEVFGRNTPTCDTESNAGFEHHTNRLPLPRERAGVRGESTENLKPCDASNHSTMSVSSSAFDLDPRATSEG